MKQDETTVIARIRLPQSPPAGPEAGRGGALLYVNFYLVKPNVEGAIIQLVVCHMGQRWRFSTGCRVPPKAWDAKRQRVKPTGPHATEVNALLERLVAEANRAHLAAAAAGRALTRQEVAAACFPGNIPAAPAAPALDALLGEFIAARSATRRPATLKTYNTLRAVLARFEVQRPAPLRPSDLTHQFLEEFTAFCLAEGVNNVTLTKRLRTLRSFVNWLRVNNHQVGADFDRYRHGLKTKGSDKPHLTPDEFRALRDFVFDEGNYVFMRPEAQGFKRWGPLTRARDVFIVGCMTGLRFSDLAAIERQDIHADGWLRILDHKTGDAVRMPLPQPVIHILEKYDGRLPVPSNQEFNRRIKEACRLAGITAPVRRVEFKGAERVERVEEKWQAITAHTARRTFISLSLELGVSLHIVQAIVGHNNVEQTIRYTDVGERQRLAAKAAWEHL